MFRLNRQFIYTLHRRPRRPVSENYMLLRQPSDWTDCNWVNPVVFIFGKQENPGHPGKCGTGGNHTKMTMMTDGDDTWSAPSIFSSTVGSRIPAIGEQDSTTPATSTTTNTAIRTPMSVCIACPSYRIHQDTGHSIITFTNIKLDLSHYNTSVSSSDYTCFIIIINVLATPKLV